MREIVILACSECKRRNYTTTKNKKTMTGKLEIKKYCKFDKKHTLHKETKQQIIDFIFSGVTTLRFLLWNNGYKAVILMQNLCHISFAEAKI